MREALAEAGAAVDGCLDLPTWSLSGQELIDTLDAAHALHQKAMALVLGLVREVDGSGLARELGAASTAGWLRHRLHLSPGTARLMVGDAQRLDTGPAAVREAVAAAAVTVDQARVITRTVEMVHAEAGAVAADKAVGMLLGWADEFDPDSLRKVADRILEHVAPQVAEQAQRRALEAAEKRAQRDRYLNLSPDVDGRVRLSGLLDVEAGAALRAALDPLTRPHGQDDERTPGQRRHDALTDICRLALRTGDLPDNGGEPAQIVVTTAYDPLVGQLTAGTLDTGGQLSAGTVRRLACDAGILPAVLGGAGQVFDVARQRRVFTGSIRRALVLRDGGCTFPGCDRPPRWTEGHHIVHWSAGGPTSVGNGVLLCGRHHRVIHHDGWQVRIAANDELPEFIPPAWIDPQQRPRRNSYHRRC